MTKKEKKKPFRPSRATMSIVRDAEKALKKEGYKPIGGVVPLAATISIVATKEDETFNVRVRKNDYEIVRVDRLEYKLTKDENVRRVFRHKV